jgi:prepilin-type N-terminal cleavage/methylation domain-containing protein
LVRQSRGFTLIELMIVIAIIAIIAAIAIPGLLSSQRAANERNASASLKTIASAEADFRGNDRDGNKIQDYWTGDVSGLYGVAPVGSTELIKLVEISVAGADFASVGFFPIGNTGLAPINRTSYTVAAPKAGYWYQRMLLDPGGAAYQVNTNGVVDEAGSIAENPWWNHSKFGFYAFPDSFAAGRNVFFLNETNTIFKRPMNGTVKDLAATPTIGGITLSVGPSHLVGTQVAEEWPVDSVLKLQYSKLD